MVIRVVQLFEIGVFHTPLRSMQSLVRATQLSGIQSARSISQSSSASGAQCCKNERERTQKYETFQNTSCFSHGPVMSLGHCQVIF